MFVLGDDLVGIGEEAVRLHGEGFNCAQCVLCACGTYTGLDRASALSLACGFGGGVRCGEICGAVSGAVMAIGASEPTVGAGDREAMTKVAALTKKCTGAFREQYGALRCLDLKRAGISCDELIAFGARTAEKLISENK